MTQEFEQIGGVSDMLATAIEDKWGWDVDKPEPLEVEMTDATDFSQADVHGTAAALPDGGPRRGADGGGGRDPSGRLPRGGSVTRYLGSFELDVEAGRVRLRGWDVTVDGSESVEGECTLAELVDRHGRVEREQYLFTLREAARQLFEERTGGREAHDEEYIPREGSQRGLPLRGVRLVEVS